MITQSFYHIRADKGGRNFLELEWTFVSEVSGVIALQLPIWRPGRYQAQYFAKNIPAVYQFLEGERQQVSKKAGSVWEIRAKKGERIQLNWTYLAAQEDAGGSVVQADFLYINFINCCLYVVGCEEQDLEVQLSFPENWQYLSSLTHQVGQSFLASSFRELVDSPFMAAPRLQLHTWEENGVQFKAGGLDLLSSVNQKVIKAYQTFCKTQIEYMRNIPVKEYTFMHWICPKPYYHGVEHTKSTMIVLGAPERDLYEDLIGVASHELFHVWNICTIRPKELLPYQYHQEVIFPTGGVVEGITTYLGDWFLYASGVWTAEEYAAGLLGNLKLHFERDANNVQSLVESSIDLWLDGYGTALPGKRVSIYYKGALMAMGLDLLIRKKFAHQKSIREVMLQLQAEFGALKKRYTLADFYRIASEVFEADLSSWMKRWMESNADLSMEFAELCSFIGLAFSWNSESLSLDLQNVDKFELYKKY
jgi:predicted metalloprotease with PDZ domain